VIGSPPSRPPESPTVPGATATYECDCRGFRESNPVHFCLRCLTIWVEGLPGVFSGRRLEREMRRAASILARRIKEDPSLGRLSVRHALDVAETPRRN